MPLPSEATIYVCAGTYTQQLTINKPFTLLGAQFGVDARTGRTNPVAETVFDVPGGAIVYQTGAITGTLDGFTLQNADGTAVNGINNSTAQGYTIQNNIITGNGTGMNFHTAGPEVTLFSRNRFVENNKLPGINANSGTSIFVTNGFVVGLTVENNLFQGNVGNEPAGINTAGAATPSSGITIQNNTSIDDDTFAVITNTTGTRVLNNTITHTNPAAASGSGIIMFSANTGIVISGNTIDGGTGAGIADFDGSQPSGSSDDREQHDQQPRRWRSTQPGRSDGEWEHHLELDPVRHLDEAASGGGTITGNTMTSTIGVDCQDDSTGPRTAGTNNTWTANIGITSRSRRAVPAGSAADDDHHYDNGSSDDHDSTSAGRHDDPAGDICPRTRPRARAPCRQPAGTRPGR